MNNLDKAQAHLERALEIDQSFGSPKGISKQRKPKVVTEAAIKKAFRSLSPACRYTCVLIGTFKIMFRFSTLKRRGTETLDFDIVQIENETPRKGQGVEFFKLAMKAAYTFKRGIYLEQCITESSQALGRRLVALGLATEPVPDNFLGVYPPPS